VKKFGQAIVSIFSFGERPLSEKEKIHREWDRQRARAMSPSERADIDAIFSRAL
jgi:hypothetical protein